MLPGLAGAVVRVQGIGGKRMVLLRRLALLGSMLLWLSVTFTAAAIATDAHIAGSLSVQGKGGGPGGLLPAGNYLNLFVNTGYSLSDSSHQLNVSVNDTVNNANPLGGPATSFHEVDVSFQACDFVNGICGAGCFIPDGASDFTFNNNLTSATLKTTVTDTTLPCNGSPVTSWTRPFTVNVTWTAVGSSNTTSGIGRYACSSYTSETLTTTNNNTATNATASTSLFSGTFPVTGANLTSFEQSIHAQGTPLDGCIPLGGKGAGPGPLAAGNYHFVSQSASLSIVPSDPTQQPIFVFVSTFANTSSPTGGSTTVDSGTDLNIAQFGFPPNFTQGCFIIPSTAFTLAGDLSSASLHVAIDPTTPLCPQTITSGLPASFTVNATWSATGPLASFNNQSSGSCGSFHEVLSGAETNVNATATGGLSGIADSFSTTQAGMGTNDTNFHIQGQQNCF